MTETCLRRLNQLLKKFNQAHIYSTSLDDLECAFSTSRRNTSNILKMLNNLGWIDWKPGIGRGKTSTLKITTSLHQAIYQTIENELKSGNFDQIGKLLETYQAVAASALNQAMEDATRSQEKSNSLIISQYPWVDQLHPAKTYRFSELQIIRSLYDTLLSINSSGEICTHLACDFKVIDNTLYFWLRSDIPCHDGVILSNDDVILSLQNLRDEDGPMSGLFRQIQEIGLDEEKGAIYIRLERANPLFVYCLAIANASIYSDRLVDYGNNKSAPVGSGPFSLKAWDKDQLTLKQHQSYFSKRALLQEIKLSHQGEELSKHLISYNKKGSETESQLIQAFSYLALNRRPESNVSSGTWQILFDYIEYKRHEFSDGGDLELACLVSDANTHDPEGPIPQLHGNIVLSHPKWTIDYLDKLTRWLITTIEDTGLKVTILELSDASRPQIVRDQSDLFIVEDIIEQPTEFGFYDWLLTGSAIRFAFDEETLTHHINNVQQTLSTGDMKSSLYDLLKSLREECTVLPLFWGLENITSAKEVSGIQIGKTGYSDFYKLWINPS
ncbi:SgrR family transcriptional regulator [Vibrio tapetis subsp. quintayensis]|uniref:SgrR family transcriptional regulator n=1 Tax=Vibrio tapetis TaxID=52443 RepID=UPI0025B49B09|nr:SgrR family transcriptional regulator [Vibrio tapetis]MDN3681110.1 SgrR family transcriptional regulator [Vibrio tapetis subsp. quintayensis]